MNLLKKSRVFLILFLFFNSLIYANEDEILSRVELEFLKANDSLEIEKIELKSSSRVDLSGFKFKDIYINKPTLKRNIGTFKVIFEKDGKERSVFYRYKVIGKVLILKVNKNLNRGDAISENDIVYERVEFKYSPYDYVLDKNILKKALLKRTIREGSIITKNLIDIVSDVKRGGNLLAILKEGSISIKFEATALSDGYVGEVIRVRNSNGVIFNGKIISENRVEIE